MAMKLKLAPAPRLKVRTLPRYPVTIRGDGHIEVVTENGVMTISDDGTMLTAAGGPGNSGEVAVFIGENQVQGVGVQASAFLTSAIEYTIDGGGATIPTGYRGILELPFDCTIVRSSLMGASAGNLVMDIFKTTPAAPTGGASICAAALPSLGGGQVAIDSTLTGWTKTLHAGEALAFYVNSANIQQATLSLLVTRF